jgi:cell division protein FtsB
MPTESRHTVASTATARPDPAALAREGHELLADAERMLARGGAHDRMDYAILARRLADTLLAALDSLRAQNEALVRELAQLRADTEPYADETGEHALLARMRGLRSERDALAAEALDLRAERDALRKVAKYAQIFVDMLSPLSESNSGQSQPRQP